MYWLYFWGVMRHKWCVLQECAKAGILRRGITHDLSKFRKDEFFPYANHFFLYPNDKHDEAFNEAVRLHKSRNPHHWEHWTNGEQEVDESTIPEMDERSRLEMICDWRGFASQHRGSRDAVKYYLGDKDKIKLNPATRAWLEQELGITEETR